MLDYVFIMAIVGSCMLLGAWKEYSNGNLRDSKLMAGIGVFTYITSAAMFVTTM
jgi:hypothetical protein